jgi:tetratricopeptide (TPR) repeat protein
LAGNALMEANVASSLTGLLAMEARFDEARAMRARAEEIFTELGMRLPLAGLMQIVAEAELLAGDADEAERALRRCWEIVAPIRGLVPFIAALLTHVLLEKGEYEEAEHFGRISTECVTSDQLAARTLCVSARARLEAHRGRGDRAVAVAREAVDVAATTDALNLHGDALRTLAQVQLTAGLREDAEVAAGEAATLYDRKGNVVAAARARALLAEPVP